MRYRLRVSHRAASQIRAAADWWAENRPKAPNAFAEEIERGFHLAQALPSAGEQVFHSRTRGVRRIYLGRIRYFLYYCLHQEAEAIEILALWHSSRGSHPTL